MMEEQKITAPMFIIPHLPGDPLSEHVTAPATESRGRNNNNKRVMGKKESHRRVVTRGELSHPKLAILHSVCIGDP